MNNKERLQDAIGNIDDDLIAEARIARNHQRPRYVLVAACLALTIAAIPTIFLIANREDTRSLPPATDSNEILLETNESVNNSADTQTESSTNSNISSEYWTDLRAHNSNKYNASQESEIIWPWKYRSITEKYSSFTLEGFKEIFISKGYTINSELVDRYLTETVAIGYDNDDTKYETICKIYSIKGIDKNNIVAVKFDESEKYYVYKTREEYDPPATLGELIRMNNLAINMPIECFYQNSDTEAISLNEYGKEQIWKFLLECADAPFSDRYVSRKDEMYVSFSATSEILGFKNKAFRIYEGGYIFTNIEEYAYYFNIGEEKAKQIIEFLLANIEEDEIAENNRSKYIAGTVTEIGENYFKIEDSVMMENENEGIEFTVITDDIKILRYFKSGFLNVGDLAVVNYDGKILNNGKFEITTANWVDECIIVGNNVLIPE